LNTRIRNVFIHIGLPKTGTTSLQESLLKNRKQLSQIDGGYQYPEISFIHHGRFIFLKFTDNPENHLMYIKRIKTRRNLVKYLSNEQSSFEEQILNTTYNNLIVSGEQIPRLDEGQLTEFKNYISGLAPKAELIIVLCTREHVSKASSSIQQRLKVGKDIDVSKVIDDTAVFYQEKIPKFIDTFGRNKIITYKFEDAVKHPNGPIGMFLDKIHASAEELKLINVKKNIGYSNKSTELLMYLNSRLPIITDNKLTLGRGWYDTRRFYHISGDKFSLKKEDAEKLQKKSLEDKNWLKEKPINEKSNVLFSSASIL